MCRHAERIAVLSSRLVETEKTNECTQKLRQIEAEKANESAQKLRENSKVCYTYSLKMHHERIACPCAYVVSFLSVWLALSYHSVLGD